MTAAKVVTRRRRPSLTIAVVIGLAALAGMACSSSEAGTGGSTAGTSPKTTPPAPTGPPVQIGVQYTAGVPFSDYPDWKNGADGAARYINAELGGVAGRPVELVTCNDSFDPAKAAACGQQFVDAGVVAVIGFSGLLGDKSLPVFAAAGIPFAGGALTNNESLASTSYPLGGGTLSLWPSLAKYALNERIEHAAVLFTDITSNRQGAEAMMAEPLKAGGVNVTLVPVAPDAADYTTVLKQANAGDPEVIILMLGGAGYCEPLIQAAKQTGLTARLGATTQGCLTQAALQGAPKSLINGVILTSDTSFFDKTNPEAETFHRVMTQYSAGAANSASASVFSQMMTLKEIIGPLTDITGATVLAALKTAHGHAFMGSQLDPTKPAAIGGVTTHVTNTGSRIVGYDADLNYVDLNNNKWISGF
jgi:branched-chain amino acid transport system substrate-binding protein